MSAFAKKFAYNAAIIGAGAGLMVWYDRTRDSVPKQVQKLVHDAVELELQEKVAEDNGWAARRKWREAVIVAKANELDPSVKFNTTFFLACNLDEAGNAEEAEREFENALACFPATFDKRTLNDGAKNRLAVCIDRLAQRAQDRKDYARALKLYADGLEILATPEEVLSGNPEFLARRLHVLTVAGLLNNMTTLFYEVGLRKEAIKAEEMSLILKTAIDNPSPPPS